MLTQMSLDNYPLRGSTQQRTETDAVIQIQILNVLVELVGVGGRNEGAEEDRNSTRRPKISTNLDYWGHRETETSTK